MAHTGRVAPHRLGLAFCGSYSFGNARSRSKIKRFESSRRFVPDSSHTGTREGAFANDASVAAAGGNGGGGDGGGDGDEAVVVAVAANTKTASPGAAYSEASSEASAFESSPFAARSSA